MVWPYLKFALSNIIFSGFVGVVVGLVIVYFLAATGKSAANVIILAVVVATLMYFSFFLRRKWSQLKDPEQAKIAANFVTVCIAALMGLVALKTNRDDARCLRLLQSKDVIGELVSKTTVGVQDAIGVPENCYNSKGGTVPMQATPEGITNHQEYVSNNALLEEKMNAFLPQVGSGQSLVNAFNAYASSCFKLESRCGQRDPSFTEQYRAVSDTERQLLHELNRAVASCNTLWLSE